MEYRKAGSGDIGRLIALRKKQLVAEDQTPDKDIDAELLDFFTRRMGDGSLIEWVAEENGVIVATAAAVLYDFPPAFSNRSGMRAYVTNMFTEESHRGKGIAGHLLRILADETRKAGVTKMLLRASDMGKPVYRKFGFAESSRWMELDI